ncbi:MAG: DegT/DnrJ/EryC1/StrS family aminotransferase [Anaerolineaceae bacterium]|nr:DegT/DnrJ/EryC1/StrS family aminotransferase [Anaerolineaceae bacterium]
MTIPKMIHREKPVAVKKSVQFVDLRKQYQPFREEILAGISKVFDGMHLFLGENVQAFEKEFCEFLEVKHGFGVGEGTGALQLILRALQIGPGDEVITVSHTFIATAEAIILAGAIPVFVDIDADTYLMDVQQIEDLITPRTKAIMPVHLYGQTVDMDPLLEIAKRHNLRVIEDACQAHGARYKGQRAGTLGDAAAFSFYYSKNLGAYGEGGFVATNDDEIAKKIRMMRDHGSQKKYHHDIIGMNARLDEVQAVVLRAKLPHLEKWNENRRQHAAFYTRLLADSPVKTPTSEPKRESVYHLYVIQAPQRDELQAFLKENGVYTGVHYPIPIHLQKAVAYLGYQRGDFPVTEEIAPKILSLPMFAELEDHEIEYVVDLINQFYL